MTCVSDHLKTIVLETSQALLDHMPSVNVWSHLEAFQQIFPHDHKSDFVSSTLYSIEQTLQDCDSSLDPVRVYFDIVAPAVWSRIKWNMSPLEVSDLVDKMMLKSSQG